MGAFDFITDLFSSGPAEKAAQDKTNALNAGKSEAYGYLDNGQTSADALYSKAYSPFEALFNKSMGGINAYADATGANGAEGLARAKAAYQSNPGYSGGLTTGVDQLNRTAAARGDNGGNNSADIIKFASDYDSQKYSDYLSNLAPWLNEGNSAAAGGAGVLTGQAGSDLGVAGSKAGIATNTAAGIGDAEAQADLAKYGASSNFWNALMGGAGLALKATGIGGFGGK
jgi:hypothetical protein